MRSAYWKFVEACESAQSPRAVKDLLSSAIRRLEFDRFALMTHLSVDELGSFGVLVHNFPTEAIDHMYRHQPDRWSNPIFETVERSYQPLHWGSHGWRARLTADQREWVNQLSRMVGRNGVSQGMRSILAGASCSLTSATPATADRIRLAMRFANYAYQCIQVLQRRQLTETDHLTVREHEVLYRAALRGERPSAVAHGLGVKVSTVRTLRQKAYGRLDANSPEQAVWRMIESGQFFRSGRKSWSGES